ncbi:NADP-dependent oxidoreductase domain-containing protein [Halteromyces radiatus]|uniref:NADP-dependent oxidoreductase domain-containing protein n=1 Tax=Halteromyces radiatus TaxID=101107 RepID=UPI00221FAE7A|nr:NADP-dependent oxidoreductase domain-containing protein [Halteromyces radiatus]KAI8084657.1 NADP-dependent oxidoreductase domain-containing protein [Halteromyces radiatus]
MLSAHHTFKHIIHPFNLQYIKQPFSTTSSTLPKRLIPKLNQSVTRLGFGGYRVSQIESHGAALQYALEQGINLIDTGANFENGQSEKIIGDILSSSSINRKDVTLVTKAGYLSKQDIERLDTSKDDYVHVQGNSYHGISPRILQDQLEQSLTRLQTSYVDIFMINAPERMLVSSKFHRGELYKQLGHSFSFLDTMVQQGVIKGYGICSNTMACKDAADHVSLSSVLRACDHLDNFCAVEAPFNLYEQNLLQDAVLMDSLDAHGIFLMTNRPLNAITPQGQIRGLYNHMIDPTDMEDLRQAFENVAQLEMDMIAELPEDEDDSMASTFVWSQVLSENLQRLGQHHFATRHYLTSQVQPTVAKDVARFRKKYEDVPAYMEWADVYQKQMDHLMTCLVNYAYMDTLKKNNDMDRILSALVSWPSSHSLKDDNKTSCYSPLTVKALEIYLAQQEIGSIITGMRQRDYVDDALLAMKEYQQSPLSEQQLLDINRVLV